MPLVKTVRPPLTLPLTVPVTISPDSIAFSSASHDARRLALSRDRMVSPKPTSVRRKLDQSTLAESWSVTVTVCAGAVALASVGGIAASWVLATIVIVVVVNAWLLLRAIPQAATGEPAEPVRPRVIARFVRSDYAGATLWQLAMNGIPALVLARLGAEDAAVYGIVWTIAISLYLIPSGMGQSMIRCSMSSMSSSVRDSTGMKVSVTVSRIL